MEIPRTQWCQCVRALLQVEGGDIAGCVKSGASEEKLKMFRQRGAGDEKATSVQFLLSVAGCVEKENENVGSVSFDLQWLEHSTGSLPPGSPAGKKELSYSPITCENGGINSIEATFYRWSKEKLATARPWNCSNPVNTLNSIPASANTRLIITGKNASGAVLYRAEQTGVAITYHELTALGTLRALQFTPALSAPENAALLGSGRVRFAWSAPGAVSYQIQVSENASFNPVTIDAGSSIASYETGTPLRSGVYFWRAKARDGFGNISEWSAPSTITIDAEPPINTTAKGFINKGAQATNSKAVVLAISAVKKTGVTGITGYYISEQSKKPQVGKAGWVEIPSTPSYSADIPFTLSKGDGKKKINVWFRDALGHISEGKSDSIVFDTKLPRVTITSHPTLTTNLTTADFQFTSSKAGSKFECQVDQGAYAACSSPKSYEALLEGPHSFAVKATDAAGNTDPTPATFAWTIDITPPDTLITSQPPLSTNATSASLSFSSTEAGSTFECQFDGKGYTACAGPQKFTRLTAGSHTFTVKATDPVGNVDPVPASYTWTIITVFSASITDYPSNPSDMEDASFSFAANRAGADFECQLDDGGYSACSSPITYSGLSEKTHTFTVKAIDAAGEESVPASYSWVISITQVDISKALEELPFASSPALAMIGVTPAIVPPAPSRRLVTSVMESVDMNANPETAIAVDAVPYLWYVKEPSLQQYRENKREQALSRILVSIALSNTSTDNDTASRIGTAIRWSIWDESDPRLDEDLVACLEEPETETEAQNLGTLLPHEAEQIFSPDYLYEARAKQCGKESYKRNWNRSAMAVGLARAWIYKNGNGDGFTSDGIGLWTSLSYGFDRFESLRDRSQIIVHARYRTDEAVPGAGKSPEYTDHNTFSLGARYRWSADPRSTLFLQELVVEKKPEGRDRDRCYIFSIGAEVRSNDNFWGEVEVGLISGYNNDRVPGFLTALIKVAFPEGKTKK